jgi:hypothetical protein
VIRFVKEPLVHFVLLGAMLFGLFNVIGKKDVQQPATIVVSAAQIQNLAEGFARTWQRPPSADELRGLIDDYVRDEVFYREGKLLGLDRDDLVIRKRLRQKMEFAAEDMGVAEPSEEQLAAYLAANADRFKTEDHLTFRHVYLGAMRGDTLERDAEIIAEKLAGAKEESDAAALGDDFLLGEEFRAMPLSDVARTFGGRFAERISTLKPGRWQGPIASSYGLHFVMIDERTQASVPPLAEVREAVRREWMNARRLEAESALYRTLRERYQVVVEPPVEGTASNEPSGAVR